ncbi:MAG: tryptophan--tRNA ligase [Oscillospiraceae bacterium]|nr:tryptophan--tRNA ligase [Oscillospiraceae bacterium]
MTTENPTPATPGGEKKKIIFSGIQPTGTFTLGNYLGALKNWVQLQEDYNALYCVVDLHSLTIRQEPKELRENTLSALALLLAVGIDPNKSIPFIQSHVHTHAELCWVLDCYIPYGELGRMTQFKDKSAVHADNINAGLFNYPALMAADILLYGADLVPVGADQKQHLELSRNTAIRFNNVHGNVFTVPEPYISKDVGKVMSLQTPTKKMSKSDSNPKSYISILDKPETIVKKFKSAVTDSETEIVYREGKDGVNNLLTIYAAVTGQSIGQAEQAFAGKGYGDFKLAVGEAVAEHLRPMQEQYAKIFADKAYLTEIYKQGAERALTISKRTMQKVYKKVGLVV